MDGRNRLLTLFIHVLLCYCITLGYMVCKTLSMKFDKIFFLQSKSWTNLERQDVGIVFKRNQSREMSETRLKNVLPIG